MAQGEGMPPGVYPYLSMEDYHNDPAIGSSGIKDLLISPLRYWFNSPRNPHRKPRKETPALKFGKGYHAMILEPDNFDKYVAVTPEKWIKAKNHPEKLSMEKQKDLWEEANASKTIITRAQYETMQEMAFALQVQPQHYNALRFGVPEVSIFWRDEETGLMCKVRPDRFSPTFVPDLKSTSDISDKNLRFEFPRRGYDISSAQYSEGMMQVRKMIKNGYKMPEPFTDEFVAEFMGQARQHFAIIWQEKEAPYITRAWRATPWSVEIGYHKFRKGLYTYEEHKNNPSPWPSGFPVVEDITEDMVSQAINY